MHAVEPPRDLLGRARARLEGGDAVLDALVVDLRDGRGIGRGGGAVVIGMS